MELVTFLIRLRGLCFDVIESRFFFSRTEFLFLKLSIKKCNGMGEHRIIINISPILTKNISIQSKIA